MVESPNRIMKTRRMVAATGKIKHMRRKRKSQPVQFWMWQTNEYYVFMRWMEIVKSYGKCARIGRLKQAWTSWKLQTELLRSGSNGLMQDEYILINRRYELAGNFDDRDNILKLFVENEKVYEILKKVSFFVYLLVSSLEFWGGYYVKYIYVTNL
jgi:hypothetical protein